MKNSCRQVLFCDAVPVWSIVRGGHCFVMTSQYEKLLQAGIFCDAEPVWKTVAERYCFVIGSHFGELLQEGMVF